MEEERIYAYCRAVQPTLLEVIDTDGVVYHLPMRHVTDLKLGFFEHYVRGRWLDIHFGTGCIGVAPLWGEDPLIRLNLHWDEHERYYVLLAYPWESVTVGR